MIAESFLGAARCWKSNAFTIVRQMLGDVNAAIFSASRLMNGNTSETSGEQTEEEPQSDAMSPKRMLQGLRFSAILMGFSLVVFFIYMLIIVGVPVLCFYYVGYQFIFSVGARFFDRLCTSGCGATRRGCPLRTCGSCGREQCESLFHHLFWDCMVCVRRTAVVADYPMASLNHHRRHGPENQGTEQPIAQNRRNHWQRVMLT